MSAEQFVGRWKLVESENFEDYLKEVGVGLLLRKAACAAKPTLEIKVNGNKWHVNQLSTFKNTTLEFTLGVVSEILKKGNENRTQQLYGFFVSYFLSHLKTFKCLSRNSSKH